MRDRGLAAVLDYSARIDKAQLDGRDDSRAGRDLVVAHADAAPEFLAAIRRIRNNILKFQQALLPTDVRVEGPAGSSLRQRYLPLRRVGICVPGGAAAYPSTVLMTVVPAQAAGVEEIAVIAPPTALGAYNLDLLATCHELGVSEVYRIGGAQGVAALAYGVEGLPRVDKIVGPGNLFVALAKKFVFGEVDIDSIAGPSEVVVIADDTARADFTAADLIAQAEHAPGASILITWSDRLLDGDGRGTRAATGPSGARRVGPAELGAIRRADPHRLGGRSRGAGRRDRPRASAHRDRRSRAALGKNPARRRGVSRPLQPGGRRAITLPAHRTCCRPAARPASPAACRPSISSAATA